MSGDTHATDGVPEPRSHVQLAICYVRFPSENIDNVTPTCPWCLKKLNEASGVR